jgi:protein O-mannosyl-transferase
LPSDITTDQLDEEGGPARWFSLVVASRRDGHRRAHAPNATIPFRQPRRRWLLFAGLGVVGALTYANALARPFMFDDMSAIVDNEQIRSLSDPRVLLPERERPVSGRPLVNLSFAVNYALGGLDSWGYHAVNLVTHVLCGVLLMAVVGDTLALPQMPAALREQADLLGFIVALFWLVHPLNSEVVAYVTQRTESMMAFFFLLTLYASTRAR